MPVQSALYHISTLTAYIHCFLTKEWSCPFSEKMIDVACRATQSVPSCVTIYTQGNHLPKLAKDFRTAGQYSGQHSIKITQEGRET